MTGWRRMDLGTRTRRAVVGGPGGGPDIGGVIADGVVDRNLDRAQADVEESGVQADPITMAVPEETRGAEPGLQLPGQFRDSGTVRLQSESANVAEEPVVRVQRITKQPDDDFSSRLDPEEFHIDPVVGACPGPLRAPHRPAAVRIAAHETVPAEGAQGAPPAMLRQEPREVLKARPDEGDGRMEQDRPAQRKGAMGQHQDEKQENRSE